MLGHLIERECAYVVERDDAVLGDERAHLQLVGGDVPAAAAAAEGVRGERQVVCKSGEILFDKVERDTRRRTSNRGKREGAK